MLIHCAVDGRERVVAEYLPTWLDGRARVVAQDCEVGERGVELRYPRDIL